MGDCSLGCVEGFIGLGGFGSMNLFALGGCPLSNLLVSLNVMICGGELTILLRDVGRDNLDRRGSIERGGQGCVCGNVGM